MVRAGLSTRGALERGPRPYAVAVPPVSVIAASALAILPIVTQLGWYPDFGFIMLIAWRLLRNDVWPAWWAAPLGFANDLLTGSPIGLSVALWTAAMLALDLSDRRTMWRDYWVEWALAVVLIAVSEWAHWKVAALTGAPIGLWSVVPRIIIAALCFPVAAWLVARLDGWRLGR